MTYFAHITDRLTGVSKTAAFDEDWDGLSEFDWGDNNRSCDCNRSIYFENAGGTFAEDDDPDCGDWRFLVRITDENGALLYEDPPSRAATPCPALS